MACGLFGQPVAFNIKCIIFSLLCMGLFLYIPTCSKNYTLYDWGGVGIHTAKGTAVISSAGIVTAVRITDAGHGYVIGTSANPPSITFSDPETDNSGDYIVNETVTGSISSTTAIVNSWNSSTNVLTVKIVDGTWTGGEKLTGSESGASRTLRIINTDDLIYCFLNEVVCPINPFIIFVWF